MYEMERLMRSMGLARAELPTLRATIERVDVRAEKVETEVAKEGARNGP